MASGSEEEIIGAIKTNFKDASPNLEKTFAYRDALWTDYLRPFLEQQIDATDPSVAASGTSVDACHTIIMRATKTNAIGKQLINFHKLVLPLCSIGIKGLPLYFSPRPLRTGAISKVTRKFPLSTLLKYENVRPKAEKAATPEDARAQIMMSDGRNKDKVDYYASIKFDGHAAIWTGSGFITKGGNSALVWAPPVLAREMKETFPDEIVLGEILMVRTEDENLAENFDIADGGTNPKYFHKDTLSGFYAYNTGVSDATTKKLREANHRMIFMAYDLVSYKYRQAKFSARLEVLSALIEENNLTRVCLIEQRKMPPLSTPTTLDRRRWKKAKKVVDLLNFFPEAAVGQMTEGEMHLNLMALGCILENQEGIILTPDVTYYEMCDKKKRPRIKLKPKVRFTATLTEPPKRQQWYNDAKLQEFESEVGFKAELLGNQSVNPAYPKYKDLTVARTFRVQGRELFLADNTEEDETDERYMGNVSIVNVYDAKGMKIEKPIKGARPVNFLIPNMMGKLAREVQRRLVKTQRRDGTFIDLDNDPLYKNKSYLEACSLAQLGSNLRFRDFNVVATDAFIDKLDEEGKEDRLIFKRLGPSHTPPFPDEPDNEGLIQLLFGIIFDEADETTYSYNRWLPALKRAVDNTEEEWATLKLNVPGPRLVCVRRSRSYAGEKPRKPSSYNFLEYLPDNVLLFERRGPNSGVYSYTTKERAVADTSESNFYVDIRNLPRMQRPAVEIQIPEIYFTSATVKSLESLEQKLKDNPSYAIIKDDTPGVQLTARSQLSKVTNLQRVRKVFESTGKGGLAEYDDKNEIENGANVFFFLSICGEGIRQGTSATITASEQEHPFIDNYSWKNAPVVV